MPDKAGEDRQPVNFLIDQPSEVDAFGPHSRVARSLAQLIRGSDAINVIGLLGGWGSGKSTVIRQMRKELGPKDRKRLHVFTYDAWLHQNDQPRRAFIEELIEDLAASEVIVSADWETRRNELAGRAEAVETTTTRSFTETGKWIFLALGFVPLGLGLLDYDLFEKSLGSNWSPLALSLLLVSLAFVSAPLLVVARFYWSWRPKPESWRNGGWKRLKTKAFWTQHAEVHAKKSVLALLTNQTVDNIEHKTKISPNPTAIEFRNVFNDLLRACGQKQKRLVVVIDNLDRLAEPDAMKLWATIRSLFLGNNLIFEKEKLRPPAIILPIDESAIARMFANAGGEEEESNVSPDRAESFIDKTFDITFQINEPVMSDWRQYLADKLRDAFGTRVTDEDIYWTGKILESQGDPAAASKRLTPRKLIKFVNAVGALIMQWDDGPIDFRAMAIYSAHRTTIATNVRHFVNLENPVFDAVLADWKRQVAAIHFGVEPDKAYQAMLAGPLRDAIAAHDKERFADLINGVGAHAVFEDVVNQQSTTEGDFVANAALLAGDFADEGAYWARHSLMRLCEMWINATPVTSWRADFPAIFARLKPSSPTKVPAYLTASAEQLSAVLETIKIDGEIPQQFAAAADTLRKFAVADGVGTPSITVGLSAPDLLALIPSLHWRVAPMVRSTLTADETLVAIIAGIDDQKRAAAMPNVVRILASHWPVLFKDGAKPAWDRLAQKAFDIVASQPFGHFATAAALDLLGTLQSKTQNTKALLHRSFDEGRLAVLLNEADGANSGIAVADITAMMIARGSDAAGPNGKGWDAVQKQYSNFSGRLHLAIWRYLNGNGTTYLLERQYKWPQLGKLAQGVMLYDIAEHRGAGITGRYLLDHAEEFRDQFGSSIFEQVLGFIQARSDFLSKALPDTANGINYEIVMRTLASGGAAKRENLVADVRARLEALDTADWRTAITQGSAAQGLVHLYRVDLGQSKALGDDLKNALVEERAQVIAPDPDVRTRWFELTHYLKKSSRITLYKNLRDTLLAGGEVEALDQLMRAGGEDFLRDGKFADEADKTARHIVLPLLASPAGRDVAKKHSDYFREIVTKSSKDSRTEIGEQLASATDDPAEQQERETLRLLLKL